MTWITLYGQPTSILLSAGITDSKIVDLVLLANTSQAFASAVKIVWRYTLRNLWYAVKRSYNIIIHKLFILILLSIKSLTYNVSIFTFGCRINLNENARAVRFTNWVLLVAFKIYCGLGLNVSKWCPSNSYLELSFPQHIILQLVGVKFVYTFE